MLSVKKNVKTLRDGLYRFVDIPIQDRRIVNVLLLPGNQFSNWKPTDEIGGHNDYDY